MNGVPLPVRLLVVKVFTAMNSVPSWCCGVVALKPGDAFTGGGLHSAPQIRLAAGGAHPAREMPTPTPPPRQHPSPPGPHFAAAFVHPVRVAGTGADAGGEINRAGDPVVDRLPQPARVDGRESFRDPGRDLTHAHHVRPPVCLRERPHPSLVDVDAHSRHHAPAPQMQPVACTVTVMVPPTHPPSGPTGVHGPTIRPSSGLANASRGVSRQSQQKTASRMVCLSSAMRSAVSCSA